MTIQFIENGKDTVKPTGKWPFQDEAGNTTEFFQLFSLLQVNTMIAGGELRVQLGDSDDCLIVSGSMLQGRKGVEELKSNAAVFAEAIKTSIPKMTSAYRTLFESALKDFKENGFSMPILDNIYDR